MKRFLSLLLGLSAITGIQAQDSNFGTPPESVWLENPDIVLRNHSGGYSDMGIRFSPDNGEINNEMSWTFSNDGIVDIQNWGIYVIRGLEFGTTSFTGTTVNGLTVEGTATVEGIMFNSYDFSMETGKLYWLDMTTSSEEIRNAINWRIDNENIVEVTNEGGVVALSAGETWIHAYADVNQTYYESTAHVLVYPSAGSVALNKEKINIRANDTYGINVILPKGDESYDEGSWSSSNDNIVRIENNGWNWCELFGVTNGTAIVTYTAANGATASCEVTVYTEINDIALNSEQVNIVPGQTFQIEVTTDPENAGQTFNYRSENEEVATVDANGLITANGYGDTYIVVYPEQQGWPDKWLHVVVAQMPEQVWLENPDIQITGINSAANLNVRFSPDNDEINKNIEWTASEEGIVMFHYWGDGNYGVEGKNFGTVTITGTTPNGLTVEGTVTVSGIKFENTEYNLTVGDTQYIELTATSDDILNAINWNYNNDIVSISQDRVLTALAAGETWINATANVNDTWYGSDAHVTVHPQAGSIALNANTISVQMNEWRQIQVLLPLGDENYDGTWSSSDENVVRIEQYYDNYCDISGVSYGTATVTYTASNGATASCEVTVYSWINDFTLNAEETYIAPGETFQIEITSDPENAGQTFAYRSGNEEVATVDANGLITAVGYGETYIEVHPEQQGWPQRWMQVKVALLPENFEILNPEVTINAVDVEMDIDIVFTPDNDEVSKELTWESSDPDVATITTWYGYDGKHYCYRTGNKFGTANITFTTPNGLTQEAVVNVKGIKIANREGRNMYLLPGESIQLTAEASSPEILEGATWRSYNPEVATVDENGFVTAHKYGEAQIIIEKQLDDAYYTDWVVINVRPESGTIILSEESILTHVGNWNYITVYHAHGEEDYNGFWSSSNDNVVTVTSWWSNGCEIQATGVGEAVITYTSNNGLTASCVVTVTANVDGIALNAYELNKLQPGDTFQIEANTYPSETDARYIYQSEYSNVASVDENGLIRINGYGETTIHVYLAEYPSIEATIAVQVEVLPTGFEIRNNEIEVTNTASYATIPLDVVLTFPEEYAEVYGDYLDKEITWTYEPEGIVEVVKETYEVYDPDINPMRRLTPRSLNEHYAVRPTGRELGEVTITGKTANGLTATANISVTGIAFPYGDMDLEIGESRAVDVVTIPEELASMLTWGVSDSNVIDLANGVITAKSVGYETVYAEGELNGVYYFGSFNVQVNLKQPTSLIALKDNISLNVGESVTYSVKDLFQVEPEEEDVESYLYIYNSDYNTVNMSEEWRDGQRYFTFEGINEGESAIDAYTANWNYYANIPVYVTNGQFEITLSEEEVTMNYLGTKQLTATVTPADREVEITWTSSNPQVVTVDENGLLDAVGEGSAVVTVTATDKNGVSVSAYCDVTVNLYSGIDEILEDGETCDVFTIDGIVLKKDANTDDLKSLRKGVYVIKKGADTFKVQI